jgi:hypothetical protein
MIRSLKDNSLYLSYPEHLLLTHYVDKCQQTIYHVLPQLPGKPTCNWILAGLFFAVWFSAAGSSGILC